MSAAVRARADVEAAFRDIGELLLSERKTVDITVYGGAAIMPRFDVTFRTADVDATVESGDHGTIMRAARVVAEEGGWLRSWFSEAVANYLGASGGTTPRGSYPSESRVGPRVYVAKPDYLLAMKPRAMRVGRRDEAEPPRLGIERDGAFIGAVGEHLARRWGLALPAWAATGARDVAEAWFVGAMGRGLSGLFLAESPIACRRSRIFTEAEPLRRARMPLG